MKKSDALAAQDDPAELELPNWIVMDDLSSCISVAHAFQLCEQYTASFYGAGHNWRDHGSEKCQVEVTL